MMQFFLITEIVIFGLMTLLFLFLAGMGVYELVQTIRDMIWRWR